MYTELSTSTNYVKQTIAYFWAAYTDSTVTVWRVVVINYTEINSDILDLSNKINQY